MSGIFQCCQCKKFFSEDDFDHVRVDLESYFGVGNLFLDHHYTELSVCPYCGSEECDEVSEIDIIEELNKRK